VLMDQSSEDDTLVGIGSPGAAPTGAVSSQSSRDKHRKRSAGGSSMEGEGRAIRPVASTQTATAHTGSRALRAGTGLMTFGAVAFVGYAVIFFVRNFTDWFGVRRGHLWAWVGAVAAPVLGLAVALPAHYPYGFDTIGHLGLIYLATAIFVAGALLSLKALAEARS
jgi:hypothetical protein